MTDLPKRKAAPAGTGAQRPEFATSMRGYDRHQVDSYIDRLLIAVAEAHDRARAVESELDSTGHMTVGPRVAQILDLAVEEAKELRGRRLAEADAMREDARTEADAIIAGAHESAEKTRNDAEQTRVKLLADAHARRREIFEEVERLAERKTKLVNNLLLIQRLLGEAIGPQGDTETDDGAAESGIPEGDGAH